MHLERALLADGQRIGLESSYLPRRRFAHLTDTFDPTTSLYAAIRATVVSNSARRVERIETALPSPREAASARVDDGHADAAAQPALAGHRRLNR